MKRNIAKSWRLFLKNHFNVVKRYQEDGNKDRKFEHVKIKNEFDKIEAERMKRKMELVEYQAQVKKKVIEKNLRLRHNIELLRDDIKKSDIEPKIAQRAIDRLDYIENTGDYSDIIKMSEMKQFKSFQEFRLTLVSDNKVITPTIPINGPQSPELSHKSSICFS